LLLVRQIGPGAEIVWGAAAGTATGAVTGAGETLGREPMPSKKAKLEEIDCSVMAIIIPKNRVFSQWKYR
jgi:hypothetical protein